MAEVEPNPDCADGLPRVATSYDGPIEHITIRVGSLSVGLVRPREPDRLLSDPVVRRLNGSDDYMPYWPYVWPAAILLAQAVAEATWLRELEVLEIGCGLGLAGLTALQKGCRVTFTDYDAAPLRFVRKSAQRNGIQASRFETSRLDWRRPEGPPFPCILGSDVLYEERLVGLVADVLAARLEPGGEAWLAGPYRAATQLLPNALAARGLATRVIEAIAAGLDGQPVRGTIHRVTRR